MGAMFSSCRNNGNVKGGTKRALLVGCNYPNTKAELAGCANDVSNWLELLTKYFGFKRANIRILTDESPSDGAVTGAAIKRELVRIVSESKSGDIVFFQFSGHGVQIPADEDGDYEEDGLDEALVPTDLNLIIDDDLRAILTKLDEDVKFTMVSDCCHSGGMLDHAEIIISGTAEGDLSRSETRTKDRSISIDQMKKEIEEMQNNKGKKNRSLDLVTMTEMLEGIVKDDRNVADSEKKVTGSVRDALYSVHGKDASHVALIKKTRDLSAEEQQQMHYAAPGKKPPMADMIDPDKGILITGCQSNETSADVTGLNGQSFGALSHCIVKIVTKHKSQNGKNSKLTNYELVLKVRRLLNKSGYDQNPCLECSTQNAQENFILW